MTDVVTTLQLIAILVIFPSIAGFLTYQIIKADARASQMTHKQAMREAEIREQVRAANAPWWSAR